MYAKLGLKSLQEYSADDINRRHFQLQFFLAFRANVSNTAEYAENGVKAASDQGLYC